MNNHNNIIHNRKVQTTKRPSADGQTECGIYPYNGILFSNEVLIYATKWMKLENIMISLKSLTQRPHIV